jgi:NAD(P)H-dependent FMN reductase
VYSYDYDANYPPVATEFKDAIAAVDAVLFVTPEYNRSISGGLKNAIDWARVLPQECIRALNRRALSAIHQRGYGVCRNGPSKGKVVVRMR